MQVNGVRTISVPDVVEVPELNLQEKCNLIISWTLFSTWGHFLSCTVIPTKCEAHHKAPHDD